MAAALISNLFEACAVKDCGKEAHTKGWCKPHYDAFLRTGDPTTYRGDRSHLSVWDKVKEIGWTRALSGCLEYNGFRNELGYGQFRTDTGLVRVHRLAYEKWVAPLAVGQHVLHLCDNPSCSEPSHLQAGNHLENMRDMRAKRRGFKDNWTHCPNGHAYPSDRPPSATKNRCRECAKARNKTYHQKKKDRAYAGKMACSEVT